MMTHHAPGSREPDTLFVTSAEPLVVGRKCRANAKGLFYDLGTRGGRCSKRHGAFFADSVGHLR